MTQQTIWIIDDDGDDHDLVAEVFEDLQLDYELEFFSGAEPVLERMKQGRAPFIIICDVNLPGTSGFALREKLLQNSAMETGSIPFIFWSHTPRPPRSKRPIA